MGFKLLYFFILSKTRLYKFSPYWSWQPKGLGPFFKFKGLPKDLCLAGLKPHRYWVSTIVVLGVGGNTGIV